MLKVSVIQMTVKQRDISANLLKAKNLIKEASKHGSNLVCLPEMWTTGLLWKSNSDSINYNKLYKEQDKTLESILEIAKQNKVWLSGSILYHNEKGKPTNTHFLIDDKGVVIAKYNKIHLFSLMSEKNYASPGNELVVADSPWGKIGLGVCYDLRFCEFFRSYALKGAEIILLPTAWPYPRLEHFKTLTKARAIENQMYFIATNRSGIEDCSDIGIGDAKFVGSSCIIDPWGKTLAQAGDNENIILTCDIDIGEVKKIRNKITVFKDRRPDLY